MLPVDVGLVVGGAALFLGSDALEPAPQYARTLKLAGAGLALVGIVRMLRGLRAAGGLASSVAGLIVAPDETSSSSTFQTGAPPREVIPIEGQEPVKVPATAPSSGVAAGGKVYKVTGEVISPVAGGKVRRKPFSSTYPLTVELANWTHQRQSVHVTMRTTYVRLRGAEERSDDFGLREVDALGTARFSAQVASGNYNNVLFELGAAQVVAALFVDGRQVHATRWDLE